MMSDFSIEMSMERINDPRTRQYFEEVISSYTNGNYRSALVILWAVAVCDLLYKLDQLSAAYDDTIAREILETITAIQKAKPKSPEWELKLLEEVNSKTHLLEPNDFLHLQNLQQERHLSAHPVLTRNYELYSPNKETVRAFIRNVSDGILTKPPVMTRRVLDSFLQDLSSTGPILVKDEELKRYLQAKYFPSFIASVEDSIFRSLWKLVFRATDAACEQNRDINLRALRILFERRPRDLEMKILGEQSYFSDIASTGGPIDAMLKFLNWHPSLFNKLNDAAKTIIRGHAEQRFEVFVSAWFLSPDLAAHFEIVKQKLLENGGRLPSEGFVPLIEASRQFNSIPSVTPAYNGS